MEELIRQRCEEVGINPDILTENERYRLSKEIEAEQQGKIVLDSVLCDPKLIHRGW